MIGVPVKCPEEASWALVCGRGGPHDAVHTMTGGRDVYAWLVYFGARESLIACAACNAPRTTPSLHLA